MAQKKPFKSAEQLADGSVRSGFGLLSSGASIWCLALSFLLGGCHSFEKRSTFFADRMDAYKTRQEAIRAWRKENPDAGPRGRPINKHRVWMRGIRRFERGGEVRVKAHTRGGQEIAAYDRSPPRRHA